ncbi:MAG: TolC family protein [Tannerellaceae bacterium]|jgi:outer membrane protein TolC|nr:TolC family protein [Tannerellaceae bacterium]
MKQNKSTYILALLLTAVSFTTTCGGQTPDSLDHYLRVAALHNPGLQADWLAYKAALQKIPQAGAYPDPELETGFYLEPMNIIGGRQLAEFKLMQMFPWFGTKKAAQTEAAHMAGMSYEKFRETRDNLYLDICARWYALCRLQQQLANSRENKALLAQLEELALGKFVSPSGSSPMGYAPPAPASGAQGSAASGGGMPGMSSMEGKAGAAVSAGGMAAMRNDGGAAAAAMNTSLPGMADVLRIQLEMAETDSGIESLLSEIQAEKAGFNALLNRPADSEVQIPESFEQTLFLFDQDAALADMENQNPMLGMINEEWLAYKAKGEMDRKMSYPMLGVGIQYMPVKKTGEPMFAMGSMNGKDMIMPMISVSIPLYRAKYKAQARESELWRQAIREKYDNTRNALASELYKTKHLLDDAARKIALYRKQEELAKIAYSLTVQAFVSGQSELADVILLQRQLLNYQLKEAEAKAGYNTLAALIRKLISVKKDMEQ